MKDIKKELIEKTIKWLGEDGIIFFKQCKRKYGKINVVYMDGSIPHPVHLKEGMAVRNFMRKTEFCKNWSSNDFDDNWVFLIEKCLEN